MHLKLSAFVFQFCVGVDWNGVQCPQDNCENNKYEQPRDENKEHGAVLFSVDLMKSFFFCGVSRESKSKSTYYIHASCAKHGESSRFRFICVCVLHECT